MPVDPVHRFHNVPDEERWRKLFAAWRGHLQGLWNFLGHEEVPWAWGERTNVGLLASAHERTPNAWSMAELPFRRQAGGSDSAGRLDLWFGGAGWSVHAEAKHVWAPTWGPERIETTIQKLEAAREQAGHLVRHGWTNTVASLAFVVPYANWSKRTTPEGLVDGFQTFEKSLWERHDKRFRTFQTHFRLPPDQIGRLDVGHARKRAFPGVILCGRIHKVETP